MDAYGSRRTGNGHEPVLDPHSPDAARVADFSWLLFGVATLVTLGVFAFLATALLRRRSGDEGCDDTTGRRGERWMIAGGVVLPVVVLAPIAAIGVAILRVGADEADHPEPLRVEVIGHQYWWEYRYPDLGVTTANELHLPVDRSVELTLRSDDVIHSFWVPELGGKHDLVPGHENVMHVEVDDAGTYRGKCAEFCGVQHAKMLFRVDAESATEFDRWIDAQRADAVADPEVAEGRALFGSEGCASCHTVRGTRADGRLGPDLTHLAGRETLAAGVLPNTPEDLRRWLDDTWEVKDHAVMPELPLTDQEIDEIVRYLETLR